MLAPTFMLHWSSGLRRRTVDPETGVQFSYGALLWHGAPTGRATGLKLRWMWVRLPLVLLLSPTGLVAMSAASHAVEAGSKPAWGTNTMTRGETVVCKTILRGFDSHLRVLCVNSV